MSILYFLGKSPKTTFSGALPSSADAVAVMMDYERVTSDGATRVTSDGATRIVTDFYMTSTHPFIFIGELPQTTFGGSL